MKKICLLLMCTILVTFIYGCSDNNIDNSNTTSISDGFQSELDISSETEDRSNPYEQSTIINESNNSSEESNYSSDESYNSNDISIPDIDMLPSVTLDGKFGEYSHVSQFEDKDIITIYDDTQIADLKTKRENGEWFSLSDEETQFIIDDTRKMFDDYYIIRIRDLNGDVHSYYGTSFYGSEEYYSCFDGFNLGDPNSSFSLVYDITDAIYRRIEVLNSASFDSTHQGGKIVVVDTPKLTNDDIIKLRNYYDSVYIMGGNSSEYINTQLTLYHFVIDSSSSIKRIDDISKGKNAAITDIITDNFIPAQAGKFKYDDIEPNVVIELWEEESKSMIARIRIDKTNSPDELAEIEHRLKSLEVLYGGIKQKTDYRVAVYLNGLGFSFDGIWLTDYAFRYTPDGDINLFSSNTNNNVFYSEKLDMKGCEAVTSYINQLLKDYLS